MTGLPGSVGTIGAGNMAEAILRGLLKAGMSPSALCASDPDAGRRQRMSELGVRASADNLDVVRSSELVVLAVKPQQLDAASATLPRDGGPLYLSIVAGATSSSLRKRLGAGARVVRSMPNTPALIGAGVTAVANDTGVGAADLALACAVLRAVGSVVQVPEAALDAVTGLSGSGPAYVFAFVEALTEAGVREGLPLETARALALATVHGAAKLALDSGEDPAVLRARVTSPGGTTVAGLAALTEGKFREAVLSAVRAATKRSKELGGS
ncbi:MAG: pyrroline-5-carboxylate reductase [Myxococcota bacterium]